MRKRIALIGLITVITLAIYVPNLGDKFINWDQAVYKTVLHAGNPVTMIGLLFTDFKGLIVPGYYAPLSSISLMLDKYLVGSKEPVPKVTKLINVLLHICNGLLLYALVRLIGGGYILALSAMTIFLLHPVQAQSVLWYAQRKTLLTAFFTFASFACYLKARSRTLTPWYAASLLLFGCGLLSKPAYASFPLTLVLTDLLIPASARSTALGAAAEECGCPGLLLRRSVDLSARAIWPILVRTGPFFALSVMLSVVTVFTESPEGSSLPIIDRLLIAPTAILFYVQKALLPLGLIPLYPLWHVDATAIVWWIPLIVVTVGLFALIYFHGRIARAYLWGAGNFIIPLLPALGFFSFGSFSQAFVGDHLAYYAIGGFAFLIAWGALTWARSENAVVRYLAGAGLCVYVVFLGAGTYMQTRVWSDSVSMWSYVAKHNPASFIPHANLSAALLRENRLDEAEDAVRKAREIDPSASVVYNNMAIIQDRKGNIESAFKLYQVALKKEPQNITARLNLARALEKMGKASEAVKQYRLSLKIQPYSAMTYFRLADALMKANRIDEAIATYEKALSLRESNAKAHNTLGVLYLVKKQYDKGINHLQRATRLDPDLAEARENLRHALSERKRNAGSGIQRPADKDPVKFSQ